MFHHFVSLDLIHILAHVSFLFIKPKFLITMLTLELHGHVLPVMLHEISGVIRKVTTVFLQDNQYVSSYVSQHELLVQLRII